MITCLLLSAGLSQRFGSPKALAYLNGEAVILHLEKLLLQTQVSEIIVVLGAHADKIKPHLLEHKKVKVVYNKDYNFGQTSSFKAGLRAMSDDAEGVFLLPVDCPLIRKETIDDLINYFSANAPLITIPSFEEKKGHPPLFSAELREEFLTLENDAGLNTVAHAHAGEVVILPVEDSGVAQTFNTREEFEKVRASFRKDTD